MHKAIVVVFFTLATPLLFLQPVNQTHKTQQSTASESPTSNASPVFPNHAGSQKDEREQQNNYFRDVGVTPPPTKDGWAIAGFIVNLILAIIGAIGAYIAICTLRKVERQTKASETAANAALMQANHIISSERAWLLIKDVFAPKSLQDSDPTRLSIMTICFKFCVYGNTPAKIVDSSMEFRLLPRKRVGNESVPDLTDIPTYPLTVKAETIPDMGSVLAPSFNFTTIVYFIGGRLNTADIEGISTREKFLCVWGCIRYRDAFGDTPTRETRFCYIYDVSRGVTLTDPRTGKAISPDAFRVGGPPAYNQAT